MGMTSALNMRFVAMVGLPLVLSGCFVEGRSGEGTAHVQVDVEIVLPEGYGQHVSALRGVHKSNGGEVDLTETPFFVQAGLEADDIAETVSDRWAGDLLEAGDTVDLVLEVPSGPARRLSVVAFVWDGSSVYTYKYFQTIEFLDPGSQTVQASPELASTWTLEGVLTNFTETPETIVLPNRC